MRIAVRTLALAMLCICAGGFVHAQFPKFYYGIISVSSDDYEGKITASGEPYDPDKLTAAHQTLPFGTEIEIENLENGKKARVKVNDRGPLSGNRLLDVSRKAAETLGFLRKGTVYAKVGVIRMGDNKVKEAPSAPLSAPDPAGSIPVPAPAAPAPSAPAVSAPAGQTTPASRMTVVETNFALITATNFVDRTNFLEVSITNTNIMEIPPYEDKFIELPLEEREIGLPVAIGDEFIMDEPAAAGVNPAAPPALALPAEEPLPVQPVIPADSITAEPAAPAPSAPFSESLLANEEAIQLEKLESRGEAVRESSFRKGNFAVQAGAFRRESNALRLYDRLREKDYRVFSAEAEIRGRKWYRVRIGYFQTLEEAKSVLDRLKKDRIAGFIVNIKK